MKDFYIAGTDQAYHRIVVLDPEVEDWSAGRAVVWTWSADTSDGFVDLVSAWGLPTDAKVRHNPVWGGKWMVVTDSKGLAAILPYPAGDRKQWGLNVGGNPHSAELLPNGNIAVAASTGGWVRVYTSSQGPSSDAYAEYRFPGAHGVHWDADRQVLWALGDDELVALKLEGEADAPVIREVHKTALPTRYGHDLQPVYRNDDRLWISTGTHVYQYVKSTDTFDSAYAGGQAISRPGVKSVGDQPSGRVVRTVPKEGSLYEWTTDTIDFSMPFGPDEARVCKGAALYKARILLQEQE